MPSIKYKKKTYAGATFPVLEMTKAEYDALPEAKKMDGTVYMITDDTGGWEAENSAYDNTESGLTATNVQDAVDEIVSTISSERYIFTRYWCPSVTVTAGTVGTVFTDGAFSDVSIPGYTAIGAFIGNVSHPGSYTPFVMVSSNKLYRWYVRVLQSQAFTVPAGDWSAFVVYEKN